MLAPVAPARLAHRWGSLVRTRSRGEASVGHHDNGITAARLILALWVLAIHCFPLSGNVDPVGAALPGAFGGGGPAVWVFFFLSGYLLAMSRRRSSPARFALRRFLRLAPGYWINILVTAIVIGPWYVGAAWNPFAWTAGMPDAFFGNPLPAVNGSMWTLAAEMFCYGVLLLFPRLSVIALVLCLAITPAAWRPLIISFAIGVLASRRITVRLPLPELKADLSYGVYIYAFPVTQILVALGLRDPFPLMLATAAITLPIAAMSWFLVERPAIALGHRQRLEDVADVRAAGAIGLGEPPLLGGRVRPEVAGNPGEAAGRSPA